MALTGLTNLQPLHIKTVGIGTFDNTVSIGGTLTYEDVTNVDAIGIITARSGINVSGGQLDVGSNIKLGNAGVITATSFVGSGANLTGIDATAIKHTDGNVKAQAIATGVDITGHLKLTDSGRLFLGTSSDLQLYHNGSGSFIDAYTNNLQIRNDASELMAEFKRNLSVDLYHDGTKRFETKVNGAQVNGSTLFIRGGTGEDSILQFISNNSASYNDHYNFRVAATGAFSLQTEVNANQYENILTATQNGAVELYHNNSKKIETTSTGVTISGNANFLNNNKIILGTGADAEIFHNDTDFHIDAQASGGATRNIYMTCGTLNEGGFFVRSNAGDTMFKALTDSSCFLYFDDSLKFRTMTDHCEIRGHLLPDVNNTDDIGSSSKRFRNIYTNDLNLSNKGSTNSVDNTWGDYTIQEGESDLFLINNRNGKKYKFNLTEVS